MALKTGPLVSSGVLMGAGLGGFVDGIVLHQMLQWHNMLSGRLKPDTPVNIKVNMFWDGVFHAGVWAMTVIGLAMLWRAGARGDVAWSGRAFGGALLAGWGLFNLVEGIINHHLLGLHHVHEYSGDVLAWDLGFLALGALLIAVGAALIRSGSGDSRSGDSGSETRARGD